MRLPVCGCEGGAQGKGRGSEASVRMPWGVSEKCRNSAKYRFHTMYCQYLINSATLLLGLTYFGMVPD